MNAVNQAGFTALLEGDYHVAYAAIGIAVVGVALLAAGFVWLGVALLIGATAILVDTWAHGYFH
jgi:hypothetical protein